MTVQQAAHSALVLERGLGVMRAALVLALFAGCMAPVPSGADDALAFGPWRAIDDIDGSEPMVIRGSDGNLYVGAMPGNTDARPYGLGEVSRLWRSTDDGATWQRLAPHIGVLGDRGAGGGDSAIAASPGLVFSSDLWGGDLEASTSADGGATWNRVPIASPVPYLDRHWMAADSRDRGYILARSFLPGVAQWVLRTDDAGASWQVVGTAWVADEGSSISALTSNVVVDDHDRLHTLFTCDRSGVRLCVASSDDAGATWTRAVVAEAEAPIGDIFPALATDGSALHAAWIERDDGDRAMLVASSIDGRAWGVPERVPTPPGTFVFPALLAGNDGTLALAWYGTDATVDPNDVQASRDAEWHVWVAVRDPLGSWDVARASHDRVHVGSVSTLGVTPEPNAPDWTLGDLLGLASASDGRLVLAFTTGSETEGPPRATIAVQTSGRRVLTDA